jgi:hypothetical protein
MCRFLPLVVLISLIKVVVACGYHYSGTERSTS